MLSQTVERYRSLRIKKRRSYNIGLYALLLAVALPYLKIMSGVDNQPILFIGGVLGLLMLNKSWRYSKLKFSLFLLTIPVFLISGVINEPSTFTFFKELLFPVTFLIASFVIYNKHDSISKMYIRLFPWIVSLWIITGLIQSFVFHDFLTFLVTRSDGSGESGRGMTSLAPEPTYFAIQLILLILIYKICGGKNNKWIAISFLSIFLLSKSSTVILLIFFSISLTAIFSKNIFKVFLNVSVIAILYMLISYVFENNMIDISSSRFITVLSDFLKNPNQLLYIDASATARFIHMVYPWKISLSEFFRPMLFTNFGIVYENFIQDVINETPFLKWGKSKNISSGYGTLIYKYGCIGLIFIANICYNVYKCENLSFFYKILIILVSAISISIQNATWIVMICMLQETSLINKTLSRKT